MFHVKSPHTLCPSTPVCGRATSNCPRSTAQKGVCRARMCASKVALPSWVFSVVWLVLYRVPHSVKIAKPKIVPLLLYFSWMPISDWDRTDIAVLQVYEARRFLSWYVRARTPLSSVYHVSYRHRIKSAACVYPRAKLPTRCSNATKAYPILFCCRQVTRLNIKNSH